MANSNVAKYDVYLWTSFGFCWTVGLGLLLGLIHYEKFGGDPQKRSLNNRLISSGVWSLIAQSAFLQIVIIMVR